MTFASDLTRVFTETNNNNKPKLKRNDITYELHADTSCARELLTGAVAAAAAQNCKTLKSKLVFPFSSFHYYSLSSLLFLVLLLLFCAYCLGSYSKVHYTFLLLSSIRFLLPLPSIYWLLHGNYH